ncbi:hypothetical protein Nepgr_017690 [Nepenthes gracilis]|uniref:DYW domain-containing protein n=1 Tax=Nepenthes gracilis TaxID=150966 RepID=A0AAD3SS42_NEPGR|nr:hypothetical protein Nepgr_017690 [Nepenthes gracilis]
MGRSQPATPQKQLVASSISSHSPVYQALLRAGPRLKPLQQVHAHLIVSGTHHNFFLLTKLILLACTSKSAIYTRNLFIFSIKSPDSFIFNNLIRISSKFRFPRDALFFFRRMLLSRIPPSNYTFTSVIKTCADVAALRLGSVVHSHALVNGYGLDSFVLAALVAFYSKCGKLRVARKVFDKMPDRSLVAWNALISGYEQNGFAKESVELFNLMLESGTIPDSATFVSVLSGCAQLGALELGCWVHGYVLQNGFPVNVVLATALINMYARCGKVREAREVFNQMTVRNVVTWTAMISGYGIHGYGSEAVELFHGMRACGPPPNEVTFVTVLSACAHAGLVSEGREIFASMTRDYGLIPEVEHHVCMVDMLGRAGMLDEAFSHIRKLTKPAPAVWTAMLGACKMHKKLNMGVQAAEHLLALEPKDPGHYVMLSNVYALAGRMDRVEMVRNKMMMRGLKKQVGYSTIEIDRKTYLFSMADKSHLETSEIYRYLDDLIRRIGEAGYAPAKDSVLHELEEEEREYALRYHSEKLAVAFGLLKASNGTGIRVVKNLRICEDCHLAIKFISDVTHREITVRDKLRFHHFRDGLCSCADFW